MSKITIEKLTKYYQGVPILKDLSLSLMNGKIIGLIGESGSGKSTLARIIAGIEHADEGSLFFNEMLYTDQTAVEWKQMRRSVQLVFQNAVFAVNPLFTVNDVLLEPLLFDKRKLSTQERQTLVSQMLSIVELGHIDPTQLARNLSGGQIQRLCLARSLMVQPDVLILDETLSGLDPIVQLQMIKLLKKIHEQFHLTILFISHSVYACYLFCDQIIVMDQGNIVDEIEFEGNDAVLHAQQSVKLFRQDDPNIPFRFEH